MALGTRYRQQQNKWGPSCLPLELSWRPFSQGEPNQLRKDWPSSRRHRKQRSSARTAWLEEDERRKERAAFELISLRAHLMRTGLGRRVVHAMRSGCLAGTRAVFHGNGAATRRSFGRCRSSRVTRVLLPVLARGPPTARGACTFEGLILGVAWKSL